MIYLSIVIATLSIQIPNIWAIGYFAKAPGWQSALWISLICLPASFISTACHSYYYGKGYTELSYPALAVIAYGVSFVTALTMQLAILRTKPLQLAEVIGAALIFTGLAVAIFSKKA